MFAETKKGCKNGFYQDYNKDCVKCDPYCAPKACVDLSGCAECAEGYFLSLPLTKREPAICKLCKASIRGCALCVSAVKDGEEECKLCEPGYILIDGYCVDTDIISPVLGSIGALEIEEGFDSEFDLDFGDEYYAEEGYDYVVETRKGKPNHTA